MNKLATIGMVAAMAVSASPAFAQGGRATVGTGSAGAGAGTGASNGGTTGMRTGGITHPPGSTIKGNLTYRSSAATADFATSPNNNPSMGSGSGTSNLPGNNSTLSTNPH